MSSVSVYCPYAILSYLITCMSKFYLNFPSVFLFLWLLEQWLTPVYYLSLCYQTSGAGVWAVWGWEWRHAPGGYPMPPGVLCHRAPGDRAPADPGRWWQPDASRQRCRKQQRWDAALLQQEARSKFLRINWNLVSLRPYKRLASQFIFMSFIFHI